MLKLCQNSHRKTKFLIVDLKPVCENAKRNVQWKTLARGSQIPFTTRIQIPFTIRIQISFTIRIQIHISLISAGKVGRGQHTGPGKQSNIFFFFIIFLMQGSVKKTTGLRKQWSILLQKQIHPQVGIWILRSLTKPQEICFSHFIFWFLSLGFL